MKEWDGSVEVEVGGEGRSGRLGRLRLSVRMEVSVEAEDGEGRWVVRW